MATSLLALSLATVAWASPTQVEVRVEGKAETLFEGPVLTEGHDVKASSDTQERACDGINSNDPENLVPGPTPTAAAVDAMGLIGETFDGIWYPSYQDYLITRWGPEAAQGAESWSSFVNSTLLNVGGCQYELREGAQVLWAYGLPSPRPLLALYPANGGTCAPPLTATAALDEPFTLEVDAYKNSGGGRPPTSPERARSSPYPGAEVAPVLTAANGFEKVESGGPGSVTTESQGRASVTFETPGWHRLKATAAGAIRSNRLDVCVPAAGESGCGAPPPEDLAQGTPAYEPKCELEPEPEPEPEPHESSGAHTGSTTGNSPGGESSSAVGSSGAAGGVSNPGSTSARGAQSSTSVLRIDHLTLTPLDDRSHALHFHGPWRRVREAGAWQGTLTVGSIGASLATTLGPGRAVFVVRDVHHTAKVELRAGGHRQIVGIGGVPGGGHSRVLISAARARAGTVELRVLSGTVGIDGVALTS